MINLTINHLPVQAEEGTTIIEAARQNHINIPNLCYLKDVHKLGSCRICVVEVEGAPSLVASCLAEVREGMVVKTNSRKVREARKVLYELMLSDHSQDCLICTRNQNCEFQSMGKLLGVDNSRFEGARSNFHADASVSVTRDMTKCIQCRRCVTVCNDIQKTGVLFAQNRGFNTEISPAMGLPLGSVNCVFCGQCTTVCPVGALRSTDGSKRVWNAISDPSKRVVVQVAPAVRVALGEEFGYPAGTRVTGKIAAALHRMGFDDVFDTNFAADLTIMEEGTELLHRLKSALTGKKAVLPMISSCSPGWIKYIEHHFPERLSHLSTCKSPHTMMGALVKSFYAEKIGVDPKDMYVVSVMPCTAKKYEIERAEMKNDGYKNVDAVITTRELAYMIKSTGIDFNSLPDEEFDNPLGFSTGAADIFGFTGGVMEAALRTVYELVTGRELPFEALHIMPLSGSEKIKEASLSVTGVLPEYNYLEGAELKVAVTSGLDGAEQLMKQVADGTSPYHFIEVMGCPGGCIMGGGQPRSKDPEVRQKRLAGLFDEDEAKTLRKSHENPYIQRLYDEYLDIPNGHKSHELLHTTYVKRGLHNELTDEVFVCEVDDIIRRRAEMAKAKRQVQPAEVSGSVRSELESPRVLELETENKRLKEELAESQETVDILKTVMNKYTSR
ncbi:MAG TPA: ferredoxin [Ruminococcaceae bacterium]|nr:ferredoxin [Oscillospiraceae bacterium]